MKVLFVNLLLMGDVVNSAYLAAAYKKAKKGCRIDILTYSENIEIAELCAPFERVFTFDRDKISESSSCSDSSLIERFNKIRYEIETIIEEEYDLVVNLTHNKISSVLCSLINGAVSSGAFLENDRTIALKGENSWVNYFNDFVLCDLYNTFQYIDVFKRMIGAIPWPVKTGVIKKISFKNYENQKGKYFIIKPTTSEENKNWGEKRYIDLASRLIKKTGYGCVFVGVEKERELLARMSAATGSGAEIGIFNILSLAGVIENAEFVIGGDTGVLHLAAAMNRQVVTITLGPGTFFKSTPYGEANIIFYPREECYPCPHLSDCAGGNACRDNILPEDVERAIIDGTVESSSCGALITFFDKDGFLSYKSINSGFKDKELIFNISSREKILEFMNRNFDRQGYKFKELKRIISRADVRLSSAEV